MSKLDGHFDNSNNWTNKKKKEKCILCFNVLCYWYMLYVSMKPFFPTMVTIHLMQMLIIDDDKPNVVHKLTA